MINLDCSYTSTKTKSTYKIQFRDSNLLIPGKLSLLAKNFNVEQKGVFPYSFVEEEKVWNNYEGELPNNKYFEDYMDYGRELLKYIGLKPILPVLFKNCELFKDNQIMIEESKITSIVPINYKSTNDNKLWNLKEETIKYCEQDCRSLYQIINVFNKQIFELFNVDVLSSATLPSLAMKIYKSEFLKKEYKIPIITGKIYKNIVSGYTGGSSRRL